MTHQYKFLIHSFEISAHREALAILGRPDGEIFVFVLSLSKQENTNIGMLLDETEDNLLHQLWRIYLSAMGSKGGDAYPGFETLLGSYLLRQHVQVSAFRGENTAELAYIHWITQTSEHLCIILER
jgi:hypothetical protein